MTLGQKIKELRTKNGLTQKDLADKTYVTFQTVSKWEKDENEPDVNTLRELAKLFNCSLDYLLNEDAVEQTKDTAKEETVASESHPVEKTIIIHERGAHVCRTCGKDIPENDLYVDHVAHHHRHGRSGSSTTYEDIYYHKACYDKYKAELDEQKRKAEIARAAKAKKASFGWGIAGGAVVLTISLLVLLLVPSIRQVVHPGLAVLYSVLAGYGIFAMLYCIISGSYIGEVFLWASGFSIKFPGLIFTWDLGGFAWLIAMKILFAILGFLVGVMVFLFAVVLSAALAFVSFPFILVKNTKNNYMHSLTD